MELSFPAEEYAPKVYRPPLRDERLVLQPRDYIVLEKLHRHGHLSSVQLHGYVGGHPVAFRERLKQLLMHRLTAHGGPYVRRPAQQQHALNNMANYRVYELTDAGERALREAGLWREHAPKGSTNNWLHDFMGSTVRSSFELAILQEPERYGFIFHDELVERFGPLEWLVPFQVKRGGKTVEVRKKLIPDPSFGILYKETGTALIVLLEIDRGTEQVRERDGRKSIERNARQYDAFVGRGRFKDVFKRDSGVMVFHVTTNVPRMQSMMRAYAEECGPSTRKAMAFNVAPSFGVHFRPPRAPLTRLFTEPSVTLRGEPFRFGA